MKHSHKKSFDWYSMQQRYSIRKYHFGAASVLLGTALVLGTAANTQSVQAEEQHPEATNSVSVDKVDEATKPAEVSTPKKETTYAAPTVANPVESTPAKTEEATRPAEKVEEAKDKKEEVTQQDAVDKSKLLTALSRAKKLESKLYTEASAANLQASIQAGQGLLGKADATEAEVTAAESSIQSAIIGLELRSNTDKGTVSETPVVKKADIVEAKEETKPAATTDRSAVDSAVLPISTAAKVETTSAPKSTNEILKPGLSLSDARQNPAIRKEDLDKGHSGFRASSNPANPIVSGSGNTVAFSDISQAGRSYSFRGYGNSRGGNSIHYDVTTVRQGNRLNFTIEYSGPGEFVNNNFILDKGDGFGNPSNATITTPRLREQSKPISQGANYVSHSGYSMTSATSTSERQTIRFSLPIINPNGDLSVRLKPVTFNVDQGGGGAATSNDPYSNSNYYYRANPLYLDANPYGGTNNKTVSEDIDFQTVYLPTSKLPEGQTRLVREGEKGQRQITYKVHRFGNETLLGLPISNSVTKEAKPRIMQIGVAKELIDTVKPRVDQNKVGDTNNLTFYLDNDGNGVYTEGVDELVQKIAIKDGAKGEKGDQGERGLTGAKGEKGDQGERGLTGAKGEKGDRGERGLTGAKGEKGDQGERGLTGAKGEKGDRGERGLTGAKGEKGDQGERGLTGAKGEKGDRGERGLTGAKGEKGDQGERGLTGAKGEKGDRGERGLTGAKGEKGDQGERGLTGAKGEKGDQGQAGRDGVTPTVTVKDNKDDGTHTITINDGRGNVTSTVVRDGFDGASPLVATQRNDADKTTTVIFYYDQNDNNEFDAGDTKLKEVVIADGAKGEKGERGDRGETGAAGRDGKTPKITTARGADGRSTDITFTIPGEEPVTVNVKDGKDGRTPNIDLNALAEAAVRLNNQRSGRVRRELSDTPAPTEKPKVIGTRITAYFDNNGNGKYDPGVDEPISSADILNGTDGANGAAGAAGADGRNGAELLSGPKAPTADDGKDGDTYIDATTGDVYKKENGTWDKIGNIRGPQGLKGEDGVAGPQGPQGLQGRDGAQGPAGRDGREGVPGPAGRDGRDGAAGRDGRDGRDGKDVLNGKVDPTTEGKDGDKYVNTETGDVFVKNNGTWEKEGNIKGPKGDKGAEGAQGPKGADGAQGLPGRDGRDGAAGRDGRDGRDGKDVLNGKVDPTTEGKDGDKYVNTETGDVFVKNNGTWEKEGNIKGPKGDKGAEGVQGPKGADGAQGLPGRDGRDGAAGRDGRDGRDGKDVLNGKVDPTTEGKDGDKYVNTETGDVFVKNNGTWEKEGNIKGPKGDKGAEGAQGPKGADGAQGLPGRDGRDGAAGRDGRDGRDGKDVLNGKVDPTTEGKDGDKYVNTETGDVFVKNNGTWEKEGNIKGPKGDKGAEGAQGPKGADGAQGLPGRDGRDGAAGRDGRDGRDGKDVLNGKVDPTTEGKDGDKYVNTETGDVFVKNNGTWEKEGNIKGPKGDKGAEGVQGPKGADGAQGLPGRDGRDGAAGRDGRDGRDGKDVLNGKVDPTTEGKDGDKYVNTETGDVFVKNNGTWEKEGNIKGPKGDKGAEGAQGPKGADGAQGLPGRDGRDGAAGRDGRDGRDGKDVLNGKVDPTTEGKDGDKYVNTETGDVFVKNNGTWEKEGNIKGPKGDKGAEGAQGPKGADGAQGLPGRDGRDGAAGRDGRDGRDGKDVLNGKVDPTTEGKDGDKYVNTETGDVFVKNNGTWEKEGNIKGPKGDKGAEGVQGPKGADGAQGLPGRDGRDGAAGRDGRDGRDGKDVLNGKVDPTTEGKDGDKYVNTETGDVFVKNNGTWEKEGNIKGPKGDKGAEGAQGPKGADGAQGLPGRDGRDGAAGRDGRDGRDGKDVLNGKVDPTTEGKDGDKYVNTETGDVFVKNNGTWEKEGNIKGPKGDKGAEGAQGPKGADGAQGLPGRDGRDGAAGRDGRDGRDGKDVLNGKVDPTTEGKDGDKYVNTETGDVFVKNNGTWEKEGNIKGPKGDKGAEGVQGPKGADGAQGLPGRDGRDGAAGRDGRDGRDGKDVLNGKVDPTTEGKDGDKYVNTETGDVFVKNNGTWEKEGNIKGPKGDKGAEGAQGPKGADGAQGLPGRDGRDGAAGRDGRDGRDGKDVLNGKVDPTTEGKDGDKYVNTETGDVFVKNNGTWEKEGNIKGPKGDKGAEGAQGPKGADGAQGLPGRDGRDGAAGRDGRDGRDGKDVLNGKVDPTTEGKDGDKYVNTETGDVFVKNNGTWEKEGNIKGPKGDKGAEGAQGPKGADGAQGLPGRDGRDGAAGRDGRDGRDGKDVLNGKVDPTTEGKDGDKYVNTETGDVFVKNNGTWEKEGNIKGPKGDKGERGEDGKTPEVTVTPGKDGHSTDITFTVPGKDPVTVNVKDGENGLNGKTPKVDLLRVEGQNGNPSHTIVTFYTDENNDGKYTPGTDELLGSEMIKDGAKGADGRDGKSLLTVKDGKETKVYQEDPAHPGQPLNPEKPLAVIKDGVDGVSPTVTAVRKDEEGHKGVEITVDNHDGSQPTTVFVHDGEKGETGATGQDGQTPTITTQRGQDGQSTVVTITTPGKDPVTFTVKDGKNGRDGRTPYIDLNALVDAVRRGAGLAVNPQPSPAPRSARRARSVEANPDEVTASTQPSTTGSTASQPVDGTRITAYFDNNGNGKYDPDVDEVISTADILNGNNGANGAAGHDGRDGRNGAELLSGVTAPTSKDGKDGDTYIDANTGDVYKKENGSWNKIGNIRGPQGTAGEKGEKGDNGKDGRAPKIKVEDITLPSRSRRATDAATTPTRNGIRITVYDDVNDNGVYDEGVDKVLNSKDIYNGIDGRDGSAPTITTKDNGDGTHTITVQNPDGSESTTVVKDGKDGKTANITTTENPDGSHTITVTNPDGTTKETVVKNGKDGKTPKVEVTDNNDGTHTVKVTDGDGNVTNAVIKDGKDGKAATATTTENPDGSHRVTITNPDGTKNEFVVKNGRDGVDGRTPTASVRDNGDGSHTIVITNPEGVTTETTVRDGKSPKVTITDEQNGTHKISVLNGDGTTTETIIKDGKSPVATVRDNQDGTYTIRVENGNGTVSETTVRDGKSPTAKVVDNGDGTHTITVVNSDGTTTTTTVRDGKEPKLEVIDNNNGSHTIKVTGTDGKETTTTIFDGKSPKANIVDNGDGTHTLTIVDSDGREYKSIIKDGKDGKDGVSPTVTVKNNNDGTHVVTIINPDGSKTEMVIKDGKDGKSPKVSVEDNGNGSHTITIINSDGTVTKTVVKDGRDGRDGRDGKDGKCGCQDKPVTPSNDKPVPPTRNVPQGPTFAMPEPPVHELPEFNGGVPGMPEVNELPEFNSGVPGMPEVNELPNPEVPGMPTPPVQEIPEFNGGVPGMPEVNDKPTSNIPEVPTQPNPNVPVQPVTPSTSNPVGPTTGKENHGDKLPETGSQSDYISILLGSGILLSLYVGRRKED